MSMSGESAAPAGAFSNEFSVRSCGKLESTVPVSRRATTCVRPSAPASPQVATALPSALTPTRGRRVPVPASRAGSMSSGAPIGVHVFPSRRAARTSPPDCQTA